MIRQGWLITPVGIFLFGCAFLLLVGCARDTGSQRTGSRESESTHEATEHGGSQASEEGESTHEVVQHGISDSRCDGGHALSVQGHSHEAPNGKIAFIRNLRSDYGTPVGDVFVVNANGTCERNLTRTHNVEESQPIWSPSGEKLAFMRDDQTGTYTICVMNADGSGQMRLTDDLMAYSQIAWSPDGKRIAFSKSDGVGTGDIYVIDADGTGMSKRLTTPGLPGFEARPEWSPDGTQIAFQSNGQGDWDDIYVMDVSPEGDTSRPQRLTDDDLLYAEEPSWSPDGTEIAFNGGGDIYKIDVNTLEETRLTNTQDHEHDPNWTADGEHIAFVRDNSATSSSAIYVMRSDGSNLSLVRNFPLGDGVLEYDGRTIRPDWRP